MFISKFRSKKECYKFIASECGLYLPEYKTVTIDHLREIAANKRKIIYAKDVRWITVPNYEGLTMKDMLEWSKRFPEVVRALPSIEREIIKLHRQFVANLIYTIVGDPFKKWVDKVIEDRNAKIIDQQNLDIDLDPAIMKVFNASTSVSQYKGISINLMKASTVRRRSKKQIEADKKKEEEKKQEIELKLSQFDAMQQQLTQQ